MTPDEFARFLTQNEDAAELLQYVVDISISARSKQKRHALGVVAARALTHFDSDTVAESQMMLRTLELLDSPHIRVLVMLARTWPPPPREARAENNGGITEAQLLEEWPGLARTMTPIITVLDGQGLIRNVLDQTWGGGTAWTITEYGHLLLEALTLGSLRPSPPHV